MPADEAAIKNVGGLVLGQGIGKMAGFSAGVLTLGRPLGKKWNPSAARGAAVLFDYMGQKDGEYLAEDAQRAWRDAKTAARGAARTTAQGISRVNAPETWVGRKRLGDAY